MKEFNFDEMFRPNRVMLEFIGIYPKKFPTILYKIKIMVVFVAAFSLTVLSLIKSLIDYKNGRMEDGCYEMCVSIAAGHPTIQILIMQSSHLKFEKIVKNIKQKSLASHDDNLDVHVRETLKIARMVRLFLVISCSLAVFLMILSDIIEDYTVTPNVFPFKVNIDYFALYVAIWIYFAFSLYCVGYIIGVCDSMLITMMTIAIIQLKILYEQIIFSLERVTKHPLNDIESEQSELAAQNSIKKCVKRHDAIIEYIESFEETFSFGFIFHFVLTLIATGLILFCVAFSPRGTPNFYRCILFLLADFSQIGLLCYAGNEVTLQSEYILDACYAANWHNFSPSVGKMIFIIMERAKRPLCLTAAKFVDISLDTLMSLLKNSFSYYTVVKTMYEKNN